MDRANKVDVWLALAFAAIGAIIGCRFRFPDGVTQFYQSFMPATVMWACGQGLVDPDFSVELQSFLEQTSRTFDCAHLSGIGSTSGASTFFYSHFYLGIAAAICWRVLGVSYEALWPLVSILYAGYAAACFVLIRLFFGRRSAVFGCIFLTASPMAISMLGHVRDFSKAPFIISILCLFVLAMREVKTSRLLLTVAVAGFLVGVGSGFRADVKLMLALGLIVVGFGLNASAIRLGVRLLAVLLFVSTALVFSLPSMLKGGSGAMGYYVLQGATEPFRKSLEIGSVPYDLGHVYNDTVNISGVVADLRRNDPSNWDAQQSPKDPNESRGITYATSYVLNWMPLFIGDCATRAITSIGWVASYYSLFYPDHFAPDPSLSDLQTVNIHASAMPFVTILGWSGFLALLFRLYLTSKREAIFFGGILLIMMAVPGLQFSVRHLFHLEIIFWLSLLSLVNLTTSGYLVYRRALAFGAWASVVVAVLLELYVATLIFQDHFLKEEIQDVLDSPRVRKPISEQKWPDGRTAFILPAPPEYADVLSKTGQHFYAYAASGRVLVAVGGPHCAAGDFPLTIEYLNRDNFNRTLNVRRPRSDDDRTLLIFSAFFTPEEHFGAIVVPAGRGECIIDGISFIKDKSRLPSVFSATLAPDWRSQRMFQLPHFPFN